MKCQWEGKAIIAAVGGAEGTYACACARGSGIWQAGQHDRCRVGRATVPARRELTDRSLPSRCGADRRALWHRRCAGSQRQDQPADGRSRQKGARGRNRSHQTRRVKEAAAADENLEAEASGLFRGRISSSIFNRLLAGIRPGLSRTEKSWRVQGHAAKCGVRRGWMRRVCVSAGLLGSASAGAMGSRAPRGRALVLIER